MRTSIHQPICQTIAWIFQDSRTLLHCRFCTVDIHTHLIHTHLNLPSKQLHASELSVCFLIFKSRIMVWRSQRAAFPANARRRLHGRPAEVSRRPSSQCSPPPFLLSSLLVPAQTQPLLMKATNRDFGQVLHVCMHFCQFPLIFLLFYRQIEMENTAEIVVLA